MRRFILYLLAHIKRMLFQFAYFSGVLFSLPRHIG
ncbi:hypothetical protein FHU10_0273 [Serratia fonticola]|jgi:hypothetical protein|uniref:Uncharacterized protein n=1 Tax=Serratia fonticola TaxID=47917 RepID=A0A542D5I9_SERFO|nr:hypothetical protein FHU09_2176 [Serratia fonticola]TQI98346.1 hypothetical protein FHU11_3871 [Serratia fonticola]TVZ67874.1 hypothetical protein FHU10_0273 [Serratia fonticola]